MRLLNFLQELLQTFFQDDMALNFQLQISNFGKKNVCLCTIAQF